MRQHFWFTANGHRLLAHLDADEEHHDLGVVIVPPHGWEDMCSYRPLRAVAKHLAASGIPALRYDLAATGDSEGHVHESDLVEAWIESIGVAAEELRARTGVRRIVVMGVSMGALLTVAAAARHLDLQGLVLWAGMASGRALVRHLKAFRQMEECEYAERNGPRPKVAGLDVAGYLLSEQSVAALNALDLTALPSLAGLPVLMLSADDLPIDASLHRSLSLAGCAVTQREGRGYAAMMSAPHDAQPPADVSKVVREWLGETYAREASGQKSVAAEFRRRFNANNDGGLVRLAGGIEECCFLSRSTSGDNFGVLTLPPERGEWAAIFLNAGGSRHVGPNRMWVEAARRWALNYGVTSLRLDLDGIGESDGPDTMTVASLYEGRLVEQVRQAVHELRARCGVEQVLVVGLCAGAQWGFQAASRLDAVNAAILINPRLFFWDAQADARRTQRKTLQTAAKASAWKRLLKGELRPERIRYAAMTMVGRLFRPAPAQIPAKPMRDAIERIVRQQAQLTLIFTEGEPLLQEMESEGYLPNPRNPWCRLLRVSETGHTFRPLWAQELLHGLLDEQVARMAVRRPQHV